MKSPFVGQIFGSMFFVGVSLLCGAQSIHPSSVQQVDESRLTTLAGNIHPLARREFDRGSVVQELPLRRMLLVMKRSNAQESALRQLLDDQQNRHSPSYHRWISPEEFGRQFGASEEALQSVTEWLASHGLHVDRVSNGRGIVEFSGSAAQMEEAFHASLHQYSINGVRYFANQKDPQIPADLSRSIAGIDSLNNFPRKPQSVVFGTFSKSRTSSRLHTIKSQFTFPGGCDQDNNCYAMAPYDFATIYNLLPLWNSGTQGSGQSIAIVGQSNINIQDVRDFRSIFGLPINDPQIILNGPDPGPTADETEADLDVEWSGAAAPQASIKFVVSETTETTAGIDLSAEYIIDNNLSPVMSESYGECELALGTGGNQFYNALWEQAAAQGITVVVSSGDSGSSGCDRTVGFPQPAQYGLAVNGIGSTPFNVSVGGTDFFDLLNPLTYWNPSSDPVTQSSVKSYIPEIAWNDSCTNTPVLSALGFSTDAETDCNDPRLVFQVDTIGGGAGVSNCTISTQQPGSCSGGYSKPAWQVGAGVPVDGKRDTPDLSLFAGDGFDGNFYVVCQSDITRSPSCDANYPYADFLGVGGTSASAPSFAGIMALVNEATGSRQGVANYVLYKLASGQTASGCNSSTGSNSNCIFNDITSGTSAMPCSPGSPNCAVTVSGHSYGILSGFSTTTAYDASTGLGSVNASNLVSAWNSVSFLGTATTLSLAPTSGITHGQPVTVTIGVSPTQGTGVPSGAVSLLTNTGLSVADFMLTGGVFSGTTSALPGGTYTVSAHYAGDSMFSTSDSNQVSVTISKESSKVSTSFVIFDSQGNIINPNANTAVYGSLYLLKTTVTNALGSSCGPLLGCPTGTVTLTSGGAPLGMGTYILNNLGYAEDQLIQLPGGSYPITEQYSGDSSFSSSSTNGSLLITPAPTSFPIFMLPPTPVVGQTFVINATVQASSSGVGPTGTFTFTIDGNPLPGTLTVNSYGGSQANGEQAYAILAYTASISTLGNHTIAVSYSGDSNYGPSSISGPVRALYSTTMLVNPALTSVQPGTTVTISALIDTSNSSLFPTGVVQFQGSPIPFKTNVAVSPTTDTSGHSAAQASYTFVAQADEVIGLEYLGDTNYYPSGSGATISVPGSDFALNVSPTSVTVQAGKSATATITVAGQSNYSGTVNLTPASCSGLPPESACSFSSSSVSGTSAVLLTITTTAPHVSAIRVHAEPSTIFWATKVTTMVMGIMLVGPFVQRRRILKLTTISLLLLSSLSCGGGGSTGSTRQGPTDPGTPKGSYTITITATSGSLTHTTSLSVSVQ